MTRRIPLSLAYAAGALAEGAWTLFSKKGEPPITRFVAVELAKDHFFSLEAATRDLRYRPEITMKTALLHTISDLKIRGF